MKIQKVKVNGITLYAPEGYEPPNGEVPDCCGAGRGLGEALVPETMWGLRISPACHIHDFSWEVADREDFTFTNFLFLANLLILIWHGSSKLMYWLRSYRAMTYFNAVQVVGRAGFDRLKDEEEDAWSPADEDLIDTLMTARHCEIGFQESAETEAETIERMHQS